MVNKKAALARRLIFLLPTRTHTAGFFVCIPCRHFSAISEIEMIENEKMDCVLANYEQVVETIPAYQFVVGRTAAMSGHCKKLIRETAVSYLGGSPRSTERRRLPFESRLSSRRLAKSASPWGRTAPNYQQAITRADLCQTTSPRGRRTPC